MTRCKLVRIRPPGPQVPDNELEEHYEKQVNTALENFSPSKILNTIVFDTVISNTNYKWLAIFYRETNRAD